MRPTEQRPPTRSPRRLCDDLRVLGCDAVGQSDAVAIGGPILHLVRHGETDWNVEGRLQGWTDIPLNATGITQAEAAASALIGRQIGAVFSSDLSRARDTAAAIARPAGLEVVVHPALRERCYGVAEGQRDEDLDRACGGCLDELWEDHDFAFDGGESRRQAYQRVAEFLAPLLASPPAREIVVVSHGGTLRVARGWLEGVPVDELPKWSFANGEVFTVTTSQIPHSTQPSGVGGAEGVAAGRRFADEV